MVKLKPIEIDGIFKFIVVVDHFFERTSLEEFEQEVEEVNYLLLTWARVDNYRSIMAVLVLIIYVGIVENLAKCCHKKKLIS